MNSPKSHPAFVPARRSTILLIGPSCAGKTTAMRNLVGELPQCVFVKLDGLASRWGMDNGLIDKPDAELLYVTLKDPDLFLNVGLLALGNLMGRHHGRPFIVDTGAGFQTASTAASLHRLFTTVTLTARPEVAFERLRKHRRPNANFGKFVAREYTNERMALYAGAEYRIDCSEYSIPETTKQLKQLITRILPDNQQYAPRA